MGRTIVIPDNLDRDAIAAAAAHSEYRWEISEEGVVTIMTPPRYLHTRSVNAIRDWLRDSGIDGALLPTDAGLAAGAVAGRVPDLMVLAREPAPTTIWHDPANTRVVVEIEFLGTEMTDRTLKPREYAAAGIATYWRVEFDATDEPWVHVCWLHDGAYVERRCEPLEEVLAGKPTDYINGRETARGLRRSRLEGSLSGARGPRARRRRRPRHRRG